jgi:hypothetical protein
MGNSILSAFTQTTGLESSQLRSSSVLTSHTDVSNITVNEYESQGTTMKRVISLLLFASLPAWADDVSGVWKVDGLIADHPIAPTCTLKQTDKQISGSCQVDADHAPNVEGSVKEKQVTWKYDQEYEGTVYTLTYTGTLDSNTSIKGTVTADPSDTSGDFTAKKQ